jgi:lyso-ornithine lipid O-acyltransferase
VIRFGLGLPFLAFATALAIPFHLFCMFAWKPGARKIARMWHRLSLLVVGVKVHVAGSPPAARPVLIVSNHVSWSDILVLGSIMELCFVAKSEVRNWAGINALAWLQRTVFIDRNRSSSTAHQADSIAARLIAGDAMVLFAEGTTGDGHRVGPFKSALFGAAQAALRESGISHVTIQPVALGYTRLHGLPLGRLHQGKAAWPGEVTLGPHLLGFLVDGAYDVEVVFCEPIEFRPSSNRKEVAAQSRDAIRAAYQHAMRTGHDDRRLQA